MRLDINDLPPMLKRQALKKLAEEEKRQIKEDKPQKYHAQKTPAILLDGTEYMFDSKKEARVYAELAAMQLAGEISELEIQKPFEIIPKQKAPSGKTYRNCRYIADFVYKDKDGQTVVLDAKGFRTSDYKIKKKLMLHVYGIEIKEV